MVQSDGFTFRAGEPAASVSDEFKGPVGALQVPTRLLMGPGPANLSPRVSLAQSLPLLGHMHPPFFKIMDEIQGGLRYAFQTSTKNTCLMSGTGHTGMEACISNLVEAGDTVLVGNSGIWGQRVCDMAERYGAKVINLEVPAGTSVPLAKVKEALDEHKPALYFVCQGESSTGVHQSLAGLGDACRKVNCLLLVDTVCSLGGVPFFADDWGIDAMYSGSQKCLGGPPGAAPLMFGERAMAKLQARTTKVRSYYFDLNLVGDYWGWYNKRFYHHTGMVNTWYAMREALAIVADESLPKMWSRHRACHDQLWEGLTEMGLEPFVENEDERLVTVNTIKVPDGIDWAGVVGNCMDKYSVEIAGGLGPTAGRIWRVGLLGYNANTANTQLVLDAIKDGLKKQGRAL